MAFIFDPDRHKREALNEKVMLVVLKAQNSGAEADLLRERVTNKTLAGDKV